MANALKGFVPFSYINEKCTRDGQLFVMEFNNQTQWAVKMYASSSKYPKGVLFNEVVELGNYDLCMSVSSSERYDIHGAYAIANIGFRHTKSDFKPLDFLSAHRERLKRNPLKSGPDSVLWAVCIPESCTKEDVQLSVEYLLTPAFRDYNLSVNVDVSSLLYTSKSTMIESSNGTVLVYGIIFVNLALLVAGSLFELFLDFSLPENKTFFKKVLHSYSLFHNSKSLTENSKITDITIAHGLKVLGIINVVGGHQVVFDLATPAYNPDFSDHSNRNVMGVHKL